MYTQKTMEEKLWLAVIITTQIADSDAAHQQAPSA